MDDWFEKEQLKCPFCKHRWVLVSNKAVTDEQHNIWYEHVIKQHKEIHKNDK